MEKFESPFEGLNLDEARELACFFTKEELIEIYTRGDLELLKKRSFEHILAEEVYNYHHDLTYLKMLLKARTKQELIDIVVDNIMKYWEQYDVSFLRESV